MYITDIPTTIDTDGLIHSKEWGKLQEELVRHIDEDILADELERRGWQVEAPEEEFPEEADELSDFQKSIEEEADRQQRRLDAYREEGEW